MILFLIATEAGASVDLQAASDLRLKFLQETFALLLQDFRIRDWVERRFNGNGDGLSCRGNALWLLQIGQAGRAAA